MYPKLQILANYCTENDLTVNNSKTKIVIFQKGGHHHNRNKPAFIFSNDIIETTRE